MNGHQRRKLRRFLDKEALPLIDKGEAPSDVADKLNVSYISLIKHLRLRGYLQERTEKQGCLPLWKWVKKGA